MLITIKERVNMYFAHLVPFFDTFYAFFFWASKFGFIGLFKVTASEITTC